MTYIEQNDMIKLNCRLSNAFSVTQQILFSRTKKDTNIKFVGSFELQGVPQKMVTQYGCHSVKMGPRVKLRTFSGCHVDVIIN